MQCKKEIRSTIHECKFCIKSFHPSCAKIHKVINSKDQMVPCKGQIEVITISADNKEEELTKKRMKENEWEREKDVATALSPDNEIKKLIQKVMREEFEQLKQQLIVEIMEQQFERTIKEIIKEQMKKLTQELTDEIKYLRVKMDEIIKEKIDDNMNKNNEKQGDKNNTLRNDRIKDSYAQITRKSTKNEIIVQPIKEQDNEITERTIKQKVDIMQLGAGVERLIKGPKGRITLECEKSKDREILKEAITEKLGTQYKIYEPNKKFPKIKVIGMEDQIKEEDEKTFIEKISIQNELNIDKDKFRMKIIKKIRMRNQTNAIILEVDQFTHKVLIEKQRMKIGWKNCRVYDYVSVVRCYKCWGYSHFATECKNETICKRCAGNHKYTECPNNFKKCINCTKTAQKLNLDIACEHEATDIKCESYKRMVDKLKKNIKYCEE